MKNTGKMKRKDTILALRMRIKTVDTKLLQLKEDQLRVLREVTAAVADVKYMLEEDLYNLENK